MAGDRGPGEILMIIVGAIGIVTAVGFSNFVNSSKVFDLGRSFCV